MAICEICRGDDPLSDARIGSRCRICTTLVGRQEGPDTTRLIEVAKTVRGFADAATAARVQSIFNRIKEALQEHPEACAIVCSLEEELKNAP